MLRACECENLHVITHARTTMFHSHLLRTLSSSSFSFPDTENENSGTWWLRQIFWKNSSIFWVVTAKVLDRRGKICYKEEAEAEDWKKRGEKEGKKKGEKNKTLQTCSSSCFCLGLGLGPCLCPFLFRGLYCGICLCLCPCPCPWKTKKKMKMQSKRVRNVEFKERKKQDATMEITITGTGWPWVGCLHL